MGGEHGVADGDALPLLNHAIDLDRREMEIGKVIIRVAAGHAAFQRHLIARAGREPAPVSFLICAKAPM